MIKILKFEEKEDQSSFLKGHILIEVSQKMRLWFSLFYSKEGKPFCKPANSYISNSWLPTFSFVNEDKAREISKKIIEQLHEEGHI